MGGRAAPSAPTPAWKRGPVTDTVTRIDTPTLLRFALLVLIPIASWIAGTMVEHLVDAALG